MKTLKTTWYFLLIILFASCSKKDAAVDISEHTYIIQATNFSTEDDTLTIETSLENERSIIVKPNSVKDIFIQAQAGEYVTFTVTNNRGSYRVLDSKKVLIANYESLPSAVGNNIKLDFIAFPVDDANKDFLQYKTGMAKKFGDNLVQQNYILHERFYLQNGIKTIDPVAQEPCSYDDEYRFIPNRGEFGNFNPQHFIFSTVIEKNKSSCNYGPGLIIPTNDISGVVNGNDTIAFPVWDRIAVDGSPSAMMYRKLIIDSFTVEGMLTLHRESGDGKKEVFVYQPK